MRFWETVRCSRYGRENLDVTQPLLPLENFLRENHPYKSTLFCPILKELAEILLRQYQNQSLGPRFILRIRPQEQLPPPYGWYPNVGRNAYVS